MLILSRKEGEALRIDGDIRIVVLGVNGSQVRIGIEAPMQHTILREEVFDRVAKANREAVGARDLGLVGGSRELSGVGGSSEKDGK